MNKNLTYTIGLVAVMVTVIGVTTASAAMQESPAKDERATMAQEKKDVRDTEKAQKACTRLGASADKLQARVQAREEKLVAWQEEQSEKVAQRKEQRAAQLIEKRAKADARLAQHYTDLVAQADTAEKKAAIAEYGDAVDQAVKTRRGVVDENLAQFWGYSQEAIIAQKEMYAQQYAQYADDVDAAILEAERACSAEGADAKGIAKELRTQLKAGQDEAKSTAKEAKGSREKIGEELQARRQAINEATKEFKEQIRAARAELVTVFGSDLFDDLDEDEADEDDGDE